MTYKEAIESLGDDETYGDVPVLTDIQRRSINATAHAPQSLSVDQSDKRDQSVNSALPWVAFALAPAFLALGVVISDHRANIAAIEALRDRTKEQYETSLREQEQQFKILWDKYQITEREARVAQDDVTNYVKRNGKYKQR